MKCLAILLVAVLPADDDLPWLDDLDTACGKAADQGKIVLLRQVICPCKEEPCARMESARRPWYADNGDLRRLIVDKAFCVIAHVKPGEEDFGIFDARGRGEEPGRTPTVARTLLLTPSRHILARVGRCPNGFDLAGEIAFALDLKARCYESNGATKPGGEFEFQRMHAAHAAQPGTWHAARGRAARPDSCKCVEPEVGASGSRNPWAGYSTGILWHTSLDEARELARKTDRLVLYYQIVGDLNKEGC